MITYAHDSAIILASIVVSLVAAFSGLALTNKIGSLPVSKRKALIVMSAFVLGGGIWSMHFVAILAHRFEVPVHYDLLQTLSSALIAILLVGLALLILHFAQRTSPVLTAAGLLLATGIVSMHFIGMLGMRGVIPVFSGWSIVAAIVVAAVMGIMAIRVSYGTRTNRSIVLGGLLFGFSVVLVHFTAMAGTSFKLDDAYKPVSMVLDPASLAIVVTVTAFVICGTFLLAASTFLIGHSTSPSRQSADSDASEALSGSASSSVQAIPPESSTEFRKPPSNVPAADRVSDPEEKPVQLTDPVLDAAEKIAPASLDQPRETQTTGGVPTGAVNGHSAVNGVGRSMSPVTDEESAILPLQQGAQGQIRIPFERNKRIEFVLSSEVAAVRADGRYTHLYTRNGVRFCPWSITEAEKRLEGDPFYRSHRSYLINLQMVAVFEKKRDAGLCRFDGFPQLASVPVSRARVSSLLQHLGL